MDNYIELRDQLWMIRKQQAYSKKSVNGLGNHPLYSTWSGMISRCYNPYNNAFPRYGARGISVCDRWFSLKNFIADMGSNEGLTLDRIDPNGDYSPENCRWATRSMQSKNVSPETAKLRKDILSKILEREFIPKRNIVVLNPIYPGGTR